MEILELFGNSEFIEKRGMVASLDIPGWILLGTLHSVLTTLLV